MGRLRIAAFCALRTAVAALAVCCALAETPSIAQYGPPSSGGAPSSGAPGGAIVPPSGFGASAPPAAAPPVIATGATQSDLPPLIQETVVEVRIQGNDTISSERVINTLKTRVGRSFDQTVLNRDVRGMVNSKGPFVDVKPQVEHVQGGVRVTLFVVERPRVEGVWYYGMQKVKPTRLAKETGLKKGEPLDPYAVEEGKRKMETYYLSKGFNSAKISILEGSKVGDRKVVYLINEGQIQKIRKVEFEGNDPDVAPDGLLKTKIGSKKPILWVFKGEVDRQKIEEDKEKLTAFYRSLGYFEAVVGREFIWDDDRGWLTLKFIIREGQRSRVRNVLLVGNRKFSTEVIQPLLKLKDNEFFHQEKMNADVGMIRDLYGTEGHIFCDVQAEPQFQTEPGELVLVYRIMEGERYRISRINIHIQGEHTHTREYTVRNQIGIHEGEIANIRMIRSAERRMKASGIWEVQDPSKAPKIVFTPPHADKDKDDTEVAREERDRDSFRGQSPDGKIRDSECVQIELEPVREPNAYAYNTQRLQETASRRPVVPAIRWPRWLTARREVSANVGSNLLEPKWDAATLRARSMQAAVANADRRPGRAVEMQPPRGPVVQAAWPTPASQPASESSLGGVRPSQRPVPTVTRRPAGDVIRYQSPGGWNTPGSATQYGGIGVNPTGPDTRAQAVYQAPAAAANYLAQNTAPANGGVPQYGQQPYAAAPSTAPASSAPPNRATQAPYNAAANSQPRSSTVQYNAPGPPPNGYGPPSGVVGVNGAPEAIPAPGGFAPEPILAPGATDAQGNDRYIPLDVYVNEYTTGKLMIGAGVNSNAGLIGNVVIDEQNFDWRRFPRSWEDFRAGTAFRGAGQKFRIEAAPGTQLQRYVFNFQEPFLWDTPLNFGFSGYYFNRIYQNWLEQRLGGRVSTGYQFTPDLSGVIALRGEQVTISQPTVPTPPALQQVLGDTTLWVAQAQLAHDTRDNLFLPTEGHYASVAFDYGFGTFQFPRVTASYNQFFKLRERPDGSGRNVLSVYNTVGFTGNETPIYERYFLGGIGTLRGFRFRGASPMDMNVQVGGTFEFFGSMEYLFPITADDMLRGVAFVDYGTDELGVTINDFRVVPGLGLRITIPVLGPAPIGLDFGVPIVKAPTDQMQVFQFMVGLTR